MIEVDYSIDMVRLKTRVHKDIFKDFEAKYLELDPSVDYWMESAYSKYKHNWNIKQDSFIVENKKADGSISYSRIGQPFSYWLGFHHNSEKPTYKHNLVIEFNPNKCLLHGLLDLILSTFFNTLSVEVVSVDVAMDIPISINRLIIDKYRKQTYKLFDNGGDDKTHYLGKGDGRIKIYNKARESGLDGDLTRYEISKKIGLRIKDVIKADYSFNGEVVPVRCVDDISIDDKTLYCQFWAVVNGFPIDMLSRRYKDKIRKILKNQTVLEFDIKKISHTIRTWFMGYAKMYICNYSIKE